MEVRREDLGTREVLLTIKVDQDRVEKALRRAARDASRQMKIPGFRPGKAPYRLVAARLGEDALLNEVVQEIGPEVYREAIEQEGLEPSTQPELRVVEAEPLTFEAQVSLEPVVQLGDYRSIRVDVEEDEVTDEQVDELLQELRQRQAQLVPVERPAVMGDEILADVIGSLDGQRVVEAYAETLVLSEEGGKWPAGFAAELTGMETGGEKTFAVRYPFDHGNSDLAGEEVEFHVSLHSVKQQQLPPLDDDFAASVGDFETLEELRSQLRQNLEAEARRDAEERVAGEALDQLLGSATVEYPEALVEQELDNLVEEQREHLDEQGMTLDEYLSMTQKSEEELRTELRPRAERRVEEGLAMGELSELEGLEVSDDEVSQQTDTILRRFGDQADEARDVLLSDAYQRSIRGQLLGQKALERLIMIARGEFENDED